MIEIKGLRKSYGTKTVLENVNLTVPDASVFGLVGINGAGKTTTFYMIVGLIKPMFCALTRARSASTGSSSRATRRSAKSSSSCRTIPTMRPA